MKEESSFTETRRMWEQILENAERDREFRRKDSAVTVSTVSTVETFVSDNLQSIAEENAINEKDPEKGKTNADNIEVSKLKIFWWKHSQKLFNVVFVCLIVTGLALFIPGAVLPNIGLKIAGIVSWIIAGVWLFMKGVVYFTSKDQREAALPYTGFNTFTPGVSWGKVFAKQKDGVIGGGSGSGGMAGGAPRSGVLF